MLFVLFLPRARPFPSRENDKIDGAFMRSFRIRFGMHDGLANI